MSFESLGRVLASYLDFLIEFATHPRRALEPSRDANLVNPKLSEHFLVGIAAAVGIGIAAGSAGRKLEDVGFGSIATLAALGKAEPAALPLLALAVIFGVAALLHVVLVIARLLTRVVSGTMGAATVGSMHSSVNAALAFGAWYLPIFSSTAAAAILLPEPYTWLGGVPWLFVLICVAIAPYIYLPLAFSGAHTGVSARRAFLPLGGAAALNVYLQSGGLQAPWSLAPLALLVALLLWGLVSRWRRAATSH